MMRGPAWQEAPAGGADTAAEAGLPPPTPAAVLPQQGLHTLPPSKPAAGLRPMRDMRTGGRRCRDDASQSLQT